MAEEKPGKEPEAGPELPEEKTEEGLEAEPELVEEKTGKKPEPAKKKPGAEPKQAGKKTGKKPKAKAGQGFLQKNLLPITAVVCIAIVALAASAVFQPEEASVEDFWANRPDKPLDVNKGIVKMIVIASDRCPGCEVNGSLEQLFLRNGIDYAVQTFEESSEDAQGLIRVTGVKKLPAFIIDETSLTDEMLVMTNSGIAPLKDVLHFYAGNGKGTYAEGIFAFPEINLDGIIRPKILLQEACGNEENFLVQLFADPYDPNTIKTSRDFENLRSLLESEFDINVSFLYNYLPTYSLILEDAYLNTFGGNPESVRNNLRQPAEYLICANDVFGTNEFNLLQDQIYATYCGIDENTLASGSIEPLVKCSDSNHFNFFLTGDEMIEAAEKAGIYGDLGFNACLYGLDETMQLEKMQELAEAAKIERTPTVLVNCQYEVPIDKVLAAVCSINETIHFCNPL